MMMPLGNEVIGMKCKYCGGKLVKQVELEKVLINRPYETHHDIEYVKHEVLVHEDDISAYNAECPVFREECLRVPWYNRSPTYRYKYN